MTKPLKLHVIKILVTLKWVINARHYLSIVHGFSPYQSVFGKIPNLPNVLNNKLPILEEIPSTEIICLNLKVMQEAREAFLHSEKSEQLKSALRHHTRTCDNLKLLSGDSAFYN